MSQPKKYGSIVGLVIIGGAFWLGTKYVTRDEKPKEAPAKVTADKEKK